MSATVETNTASWRKRSREDDTTTQMDLKRPRHYYFRLESESSKASEEDTESICSLQDRETDVVRDTSDTDSKSGSSDEYEVHYEEYEVASLSGSENGFTHSNSSSDSEASMMLAAAAAVICDSSLDWITDCEDSDNSSLEESSFAKMGFSTCVQCKSVNDNPLFRYCDKCFQDRKKFYPPRPKRNRKSRKDKQKEPPVKLDMLRSCLKDLSQDSGIGSSQEWPLFGMAQIVVPDDRLPSGTSNVSTVTESSKSVDDSDKKSSPEQIKAATAPDSSSFSSTDTNRDVKENRKRYISESSLSDFDVNPRPSKISKLTPFESLSQTSDLGSEVISGGSFSEGLKTGNSENSELCMFCNDAPKDAIFLHSKVAHQCCCYRCAKRTIKTRRRCPICNVAVSKVFRVIKS